VVLSPCTRRRYIHDNLPTCDLVILVEKGEENTYGVRGLGYAMVFVVIKLHV